MSGHSSVRVSVIIPCYKDAETLGGALASVYAQTHPVDEVVVVNDCSPQTAEIERVVSAYPSVVYIRNTTNLGLAASRNVGLRASSCEVATFLDADDELHPQKIELQLAEYREGIAVACRVERFVAGGRDRLIHYEANYTVRTVQRSRAIIRRNRLTGASIMASRALLLRFGGYDDTLRSCEDFDLWLRLLDAGVVARDIQLPLYRYRVNPNGLSRNYQAISYWELEALRRYFQRRGSTFLRDSEDAAIWAFWLLKHVWRYEVCRDERLRLATRDNINALAGHFLLKTSLRLLDRSRILLPVAALWRYRTALGRRVLSGQP